MLKLLWFGCGVSARYFLTGGTPPNDLDPEPKEGFQAIHDAS